MPTLQYDVTQFLTSTVIHEQITEMPTFQEVPFPVGRAREPEKDTDVFCTLWTCATFLTFKKIIFFVLSL